MKLITDLKDKRLVNADSEAMNVLRDSLRAALEREAGLLRVAREIQKFSDHIVAERDAALSRAEEAERKLYAAREVLYWAADSNTVVTGPRTLETFKTWRMKPQYHDQLTEKIAALSSSSPCRHESALAELRGRISVEGMAKVIYGALRTRGSELDIARALRDYLMGKEKG